MSPGTWKPKTAQVSARVRAGQLEKDPTHSAVFGVKLQERLRKMGVECYLCYPGSPETKYRSRYEFLVDQLTK